MHSPTGELIGVQARPDNPRSIDGRIAKYEVPRKQANGLDVPWRVRNLLTDVTVPLVITEGCLKADAGAGVGLCVTSITGVWGGVAKRSNDSETRELLTDFDHVALEGRDVVMAFDADALTKRQVQYALREIARLLQQKGAKILYVHWPASDIAAIEPAKLGLDDWVVMRLSDGRSHAEICDAFYAMCSQDVPAMTDGGDAESLAVGGSRARVLLNGPGFQQVDDTSAALSATNEPPTIFRLGGNPGYVTTDATGVRSVQHTRATFTDAVDRQVQFLKFSPAGWLPAPPPAHVLAVLFDRPGLDWAPELALISCSPVVRPDGTVAATAGYDRDTGVFLDLTGAWPVVPEHPTEAEVAVALDWLLDHLLCDFPFQKQADLANYLAFLFTPLLRPAFTGCTPLFVIDANMPASGKTLLAEIASIITVGRSMPLSPLSGDDEELRKAIMATLLSSTPLVTFDNVDHQLRSARLALLLTSESYSDRKLGHSQIETRPNRTVWAVTGNNVTVGGDLARRVVKIRLETDRHDPQNITGFKHDDLRGWARSNRRPLVASLLTLARNWYNLGCPPGERGLGGGFDEWSRVVGGILKAAGISGFLEGREEQVADSDVDGEVWASILHRLHERWPAHFTTRSLDDPLNNNSDILELFEYVLPHSDMRATNWKTTLGKALKSQVGRYRVLDDAIYQLTSPGKDREGVRIWRVEVRGDAGNRGGSPQSEEVSPRAHTETASPTMPRAHRDRPRASTPPALPALLITTCNLEEHCTLCNQPVATASTLCTAHLLNGPHTKKMKPT
ncbi:MAG: DUF3854 domain-containing protein [Ilumatobacteraceae bacterium]